MTQVNEATARATRGGLQGGAGWAVVEVLEQFGIYDFTQGQASITILVLSAVFSYVQNTLENKGKIPALLRQVPPTEVPVVDRPEDPPPA